MKYLFLFLVIKKDISLFDLILIYIPDCLFNIFMSCLFPFFDFKPFFVLYMCDIKSTYQLGAVAHSCNPSILGGRGEWIHEVKRLRPYWSTWWNPVSTKNSKISWAWWCVPVIPATQEAEAGELPEPRGGGCGEPRSHHCTPAWVTQGDPVSKTKKQTNKQNSCLVKGID